MILFIIWLNTRFVLSGSFITLYKTKVFIKSFFFPKKINILTSLLLTSFPKRKKSRPHLRFRFSVFYLLKVHSSFRYLVSAIRSTSAHCSSVNVYGIRLIFKPSSNPFLKAVFASSIVTGA